ncbi:hypothetical protein AX14_008715 [Amanita brunnescens Koide BX004]|nr:hypothetical protein AX14_008715 [Amanita brunnescens Koide BX004]
MSESQFKKAVEIVQSLPKDGPVKPSSDDQLHFYKHYKQVTVGDVNITRPGFMDFVGKQKWDAWDSVKGRSKEECRKAYVDKLIQLLKDAGKTDQVAEIEAA